MKQLQFYRIHHRNNQSAHHNEWRFLLKIIVIIANNWRLDVIIFNFPNSGFLIDKEELMICKRRFSRHLKIAIRHGILGLNSMVPLFLEGVNQIQ